MSTITTLPLSGLSVWSLTLPEQLIILHVSQQLLLFNKANVEFYILTWYSFVLIFLIRVTTSIGFNSRIENTTGVWHSPWVMKVCLTLYATHIYYICCIYIMYPKLLYAKKNCIMKKYIYLYSDCLSIITLGLPYHIHYWK